MNKFHSSYKVTNYYKILCNYNKFENFRCILIKINNVILGRCNITKINNWYCHVAMLGVLLLNRVIGVTHFFRHSSKARVYTVKNTQGYTL